MWLVEYKRSKIVQADTSNNAPILRIQIFHIKKQQKIQS